MNPIDENRLSSLLRNPATRSDSLDNVSLLSDLRRHPMQNIAMQDAALMQQAQTLAMANDPSTAGMRMSYPHDKSNAASNSPFPPGFQQDGVADPHNAASLLQAGLAGAGGFSGVGPNPYQHLYPGMLQMQNPSTLNGTSLNNHSSPAAASSAATDGLTAYGQTADLCGASSSANVYAEEMLRRLQLQKAAANAYGAANVLGVPGRDLNMNINAIGNFMGSPQQQKQQYAGTPGTTSGGLTNRFVSAMQLQSLPHNHTASNLSWFVCRKCGERAFRSEMELVEHEISCPHQPHLRQAAFNANDLMNASSSAYANMMDPSIFNAASHYRGDNLNPQTPSATRQGQDDAAPSWKNSKKSGQSYTFDSMRKESPQISSSHTQRIEAAAEASKPSASRSTNTSSSSSTTSPNTDPHEIEFREEDGETEYKQLAKSLPLAMSSDSNWITPLHCFVREHCVEIFTANDADVYTPSKGKRRPIHVGQVGIRCPHCHANPDGGGNKSGREKGSVYYPTTIASIYNATMNLLQRHLSSCDHVPSHILQRYSVLKADDARSGTSKKYWVDSAKSLGLVDTPAGIRISGKPRPPLPSLNNQQKSMKNTGDMFSSTSNAFQTTVGSGDIQNGTASEGTIANGGASDGNNLTHLPDVPLVTVEDKSMSTSFSLTLLTQMRACVFTEADRLGKRKGLPLGFSGLACKHCYGGYGSGRFFPSSIKTMSDTSKTLNVLHCHMMRCRKCPIEVRVQLQTLRMRHDEERAKMKFGSQKAFFTKIWERLHGESPPDKSSNALVLGASAIDASGVNQLGGAINAQEQPQQQIQEQAQPMAEDTDSTPAAATDPKEMSSTEPIESIATKDIPATSQFQEGSTSNNEQDSHNLDTSPVSDPNIAEPAETEETLVGTQDTKPIEEEKVSLPSSSPVLTATDIATDEAITSEEDVIAEDSSRLVVQTEETPQVEESRDEEVVVPKTMDGEVQDSSSTPSPSEAVMAEENTDTTEQNLPTCQVQNENGVDSINPSKRVRDEVSDVENVSIKSNESEPDAKKQRLG